MDNRDSSGSPAAVAGRDGSAEEDGILSITSGLAQEAAVLFQSRRYTECIDVLKQLLQKKEDDPKILHNIAVAEYCHDSCPDPKRLLDVFDKVKVNNIASSLLTYYLKAAPIEILAFIST